MSKELYVAKLSQTLLDMQAAGLAGTSYYADLYQTWQDFQQWNPLLTERDRIHNVLFGVLGGKQSTECNACGMRQKCYARNISPTTLHELFNLWFYTKIQRHPKMDSAGFIASKYIRPSYLNGGGDAPKLRFWGMLEPRDPVQPGKKSNSGYSRLCTFGEQWLTAPFTNSAPVYAWRRVYLYDNLFVGWDTKKPVQSSDIKRERDDFDFDKLMRGTLGL